MNSVSLPAMLFLIAEVMLALYLIRRRVRRLQVAREYKSMVRNVLVGKSQAADAQTASVVSAGLES